LVAGRFQGSPEDVDVASATARDRPTEKEARALAALRLKPAGLSPLNVGVAIAGEDARRAERETLIRSGNQVLSALARHGLVARIQPRKLSWPIFKITDEGVAAVDAYTRGRSRRRS
jgi:hypothetical protein